MSEMPASVVLRMLAQLAVRRTCQLGAIVSVAALIQGIYVYAKYGIFHRHQSHPIVPSGGSVTAARRRRHRRSRTHTTTTSSCQHHSTSPTPQRRRLLIVGDSLAVGVGCSGSHPSLPIAIARGLSDQWGGIQVEWDSIGVVGADTPTIYRTVQAHLASHNNSKADGAPYDVVVVIAGLNDTKHAALPWLWRSRNDGSAPVGGPAGFERELQGLVRMIQHNTNHHAAVVLPALPVNFSPFLSLQPLATFLHPILSLWDRKKESLASRFPNVHFVKPPTAEELRMLLANESALQPHPQQQQQPGAAAGSTQVPTNKPLMISDTEGEVAAIFLKPHNKGIHSRDLKGVAYESSGYSSSGSSSEEETTRLLVRHVSSRDKVHPNDLGYCLWGSHIARSIGAWLSTHHSIANGQRLMIGLDLDPQLDDVDTTNANTNAYSSPGDPCPPKCDAAWVQCDSVAVTCKEGI
eukprot:c15076_g1_i1.p1 GENE.c15076_g1_i1~~c15076_g1_i1.p1  ORF type:complete len:464 (-),score=96.57 c15076_g1_i1:101-1492(-)